MKSFRLISFCLLLLFVFGCSEDQKEQDGKRPAPVRIAVTTVADVPRTIEAVGNVEASASVNINPQVGGQIVEVPVLPGRQVKAGDLLFRLDPRPFQAALAEAEARLARDRALLEKARRDLARYSAMLKEEAISREAYDQILTTEKTTKADIGQDEAAVQTAKLNLAYSEIRSPISGRLGDIFIRNGNVVKANDDRPLATINALQPVEVRFTVAERLLPLVLERMKEGTLTASVSAEGDVKEPVTATVAAVDNKVDRTTGSVLLIAVYGNEDERLWPGRFVRVSLTVDTLRDAVLVPEQAVQEGLNGPYVYVARKEKDDVYRVAVRNVETVPGPKGFRVALSGLAAGETVVTDGQLALRPDALGVVAK